VRPSLCEHDLAQRPLWSASSGKTIASSRGSGGISEARKIAAMAETHHLPVASHDATGPVTLIAGNHVVMNAPNGLAQEIVRSYYTTWYRDIVTDLPAIEQGMMRPLTGPGLGTRLQDALLRRPDTRIRASTG
jgi:L-alanine-DL-glutamate epimerase-like enolase superfamily enzyme